MGSVPMGVCPRGVCPWGVCPWGVCPRGVCPWGVCSWGVCSWGVCPWGVCSWGVCPWGVCSWGVYNTYEHIYLSHVPHPMPASHHVCLHYHFCAMTHQDIGIGSCIQQTHTTKALKYGSNEAITFRKPIFLQ